MKVKRVYAIDTLGKYPIAFVEFEGCCPQWEQYQNNEQIKEYLASHSDYVINNPYWKY
mgnify:CR=1 FL=1